MTVAENLMLGRLPRRLGVVDWDEVHARAREILAACGVELDPETRVGDLGVASQQLVEIARAIAKNPKVLVLDEPTAALASQEIERLLALVRDLRSRGVACIYISHKLDEVFGIADRITVLRDGESIATLSAAQTNPAEIIRLMVGRTIEDLFPRRHSTPGQPLLEVEALSVAERAGVPPFLRDLSLTVRAGEVLGIGGLMGAGRSELLMHLFGVWGHRVTGRVLLNGAPMPTPTPADALQSGLALVTEDRKRFGLVMEHGVTFNLSLSSLRRLVRHLLLQQDAEIARARTFVKSLHIKTHRLDSPVQTLSGGNQQKVVIGKVAHDRAQRPVARRADARHRRRCQARSVRAHQPPDGRGQGHRAGVERADRAPRPERPHRDAVRGTRSVASSHAAKRPRRSCSRRRWERIGEAA